MLDRKMMPDPDSVETVAMTPAATQLPHTTPMPDQRFLPGTLLASRYRIVSRLGKGGMGEVFRADDLILGQAVALKFLPESAKGNLNLLTRFYDEVRIARQIAHKNVCRVYDIGEVDGQPYLSMEYIDGEDLASLLRRIGRLPADKAIEFARKICAGVAAAHAQGVLHRDLKPANIMVDARGEVHITDFGLAAIAEQLQGSEIRSGTPAYMAPEQLSGKEVSAQSDIYALGLVLYEMFTGKPPFQADTVAEILKLRQQSPVTNPSTLIPELDKTVERAILRCLDPDPKLRPASALALAGSLPGGDPLAAALAAGETPSPETVASAGSTEGLNPKIAISALAGIAVTLIAVCLLTPQVEVAGQVPLENGPEVLAAKARDIARAIGLTERPADTASGFAYTSDLMLSTAKSISGREQWRERLSHAPYPVWFWYRQSPTDFVSVRTRSSGSVTRDDPPQDVSGMATLGLDLEGRLLSFTAVPPQMAPMNQPPQPIDWSPLFAAAQLDMSKFQPVKPQWAPLAATDARAAWTGLYPGRSDLPIRVEAASFLGRPVFFTIVWPWSHPTLMPGSTSGSMAARASDLAQEALFVAVILAAALIARHNAKAGRGDFRGGVRIGVYAATLSMVEWALGAHHLATPAEQDLLFAGLADAAFAGALYWVLYLALEPWVRRYWPQTLITWSRVLAGRWRDPLVGRDILFAVLFGLLYLLVFQLFHVTMVKLGEPPQWGFGLRNLLGFRGIGYVLVDHLSAAIGVGLAFLLLLFLLRAVLRSQWLAAAGWVAIMTVVRSLQAPHPVISALFWILIWGIVVTIMLRFGLFALMLTIGVLDTMGEILLTSDFSAWYGQSSVIIVTILTALALWGFRLSLRGAGNIARSRL
jgi:serine/threonine protein kinase